MPKDGIMEKAYNYQEIEDYVNKKLSTSESADFEAKMAKDSNLTDEVNFYKDVAKVTKYKSQKDIENTISAAESELSADGFFNHKANKTGNTRVFRLRNIQAIAASFLVLIVAGFWIMSSNYSNEGLVADHFSDTGISSGLRSSDNPDDPFTPGLIAMEEENFEKAAEFFSSISETDEAYYEARLFLAKAQLKNGNFDWAAENAILVSGSESVFKFEAEWLHLKILLSAGKTGPEFDSLLDNLAQNGEDEFYKNKGIDLQKKMNSFWRKTFSW